MTVATWLRCAALLTNHSTTILPAFCLFEISLNGMAKVNGWRIMMTGGMIIIYIHNGLRLNRRKSCEYEIETPASSNG